MCVYARAPPVPRHSWVEPSAVGGYVRVAVGGVSPPPLFFRGGVISRPSWLRGAVCGCGSRPCRVVVCGVRCRLFQSWPPWSPLLLPPSFAFFFAASVAVWPAACHFPGGGVRRRVRSVFSSGSSAALWSWWAAFLAGRLRAWRGGPLVSDPRVLWVCPLVLPGWGVARLGGVGARLRGCATAPPAFLLSLWPAGVRSWVDGVFPLPWFFFLRGRCLFFPLPSLGWCMHWSANGVANWVVVDVVAGRGPCPGSVRRVVYVHAWDGGPSCIDGLGSGSAGWAVALAGFLGSWTRGVGLPCAPPPLRCRFDGCGL